MDGGLWGFAFTVVVVYGELYIVFVDCIITIIWVIIIDEIFIADIIISIIIILSIIGF